MARQRTEELEQKLIEHEVRLSKAREAGALYALGREARKDSRSSVTDRRWYREQLVSMLIEARTEADLEGLGFSDEVVREARLGNSVHEAWARFHCPPLEEGT
jgi:hypothetical protein